MGECLECGMILVPHDWKQKMDLICPRCGHANDIKGLREHYEKKQEERAKTRGQHWYEKCPV